MIYLLIQSEGDYEDNRSEAIFASKSKESCEKKHQELITRNRFYHRIANHLNAAFDQDCKALLEDPPKAPDLLALPIRPPVWTGGGWSNAYVIEHDKLMSEWSHKRMEILEKITNDLMEIYKVDRDAVNMCWANFNPTYSIEEVESDI